MRTCHPDIHLRYAASNRDTCPVCGIDLFGSRTELAGIRKSQAAIRTVWTWSIPYQVKLSAGPYVARSSDGGPYHDRENAIASAHAARWQLMDLHGKRHVGRYELRTHEAKAAQPTIEEAAPEKIESLRQQFPGLFTTPPP